MASQPSTFVTPEEYLERERAAPTKSEYYRGEVFAMAGASEAHVLIVTNLVIELGNRLRKKDWRVYSNDMRLRISPAGLYTYPDVMVVCGKPIFADEHFDLLVNPVLIIEVLSESTKDYDRAGKFDQYRQIESVREYVTVSQTEKLADHWVRQGDNSWVFRQVRPETGKIQLGCLGLELDLGDVYDKVEIVG